MIVLEFKLKGKPQQYRVINAALNILAKGLKQAGIVLNTVGHTGINAWGQTDLYSLVVTSTGKLTD